ncbi:UNVERIFIED_CONTAM: hypothetical protein Sangu_2662900 [Sesamum angustifolium]|uniref:Integrase catalytic domain-containing protein n=1 Tax=Sesamum angustifolium TaxID=2727405 RepID=A0AAW2J2T8_9LAMI
MKPPVLVAPVPGRLLILYVAAQECSVGILLAQKKNEGKENALYYLSRRITPNELKYSPVEKLCLALIFSIQKVKHYFQSHSIHLVSKANPLKYVMAKPVLSDRLARWYLQLQQFEITYVPQKTVKGQVRADFLADHPMPAELSDDLPDEDVLVIEVTPPWKMYFDGASHKKGAVAGVVFVTSKGEVLPDDEDDMLQEEENHVTEVFEVEEEDWRQPLVDYLKYRKLPNDKRMTDTHRRATRFINYKGKLYIRSFDGIFLRCLSDNEKVQAMEEAHSGVCGAHQSGPKLHFRLKRIGYYWPTMVKHCIDYARRCQACQFHANLIHQLPEPLHPTVASWPFDAWGLDVVGPLTKSFGGHLYILAATDYFSKWAEAVPLKEVKKENVADFICTHIIYRYRVPRHIITDNGKPFCNSLIDKVMSKV